MFGFKKKKENIIITDLERTNDKLRRIITNEQEARKFAEECKEEEIQNHVSDLEKIKEVLNSKEQWKRKELETNAYLEVALNKLKGKED